MIKEKQKVDYVCLNDIIYRKMLLCWSYLIYKET